jgi:hypothetical protein
MSFATQVELAAVDERHLGSFTRPHGDLKAHALLVVRLLEQGRRDRHASERLHDSDRQP